jgi:hypothetical protein
MCQDEATRLWFCKADVRVGYFPLQAYMFDCLQWYAVSLEEGSISPDRFERKATVPFFGLVEAAAAICRFLTSQ